MYIDGKRRGELKKQFQNTKDNLNKFKGKQIKLIKFEVFSDHWKGWRDYSLVHPTINQNKEFLGMSNEKLCLKDSTGKIIKLDVYVSSNAFDVIEFKDNVLTITYNDLNRFRWYNGKGVRLSYLFID